jgi:hypothetical protein
MRPFIKFISYAIVYVDSFIIYDLKSSYNFQQKHTHPVMSICEQVNKQSRFVIGTLMAKRRRKKGGGKEREIEEKVGGREK